MRTRKNIILTCKRAILNNFAPSTFYSVIISVMVQKKKKTKLHFVPIPQRPRMGVSGTLCMHINSNIQIYDVIRVKGECHKMSVEPDYSL